MKMAAANKWLKEMTEVAVDIQRHVYFFIHALKVI